MGVGLFLASMGAIVFVYGGVEISGAWQRQSNAERVLSLSQASRTALAALQNIRLERGSIANGLTAATPADSTAVARIIGYRKDAEASYAKLRATLEASGLPQALQMLPKLKQAHDAVTALHAGIDADLVKEKSARNPQSLPTSQSVYQALSTP